MVEKQVEAELAVVTGKIAKKQAEIASLEKWADELRTSLRVLRRLSGSRDEWQPESTHIAAHNSANDSQAAVRQAGSRERPLAAGRALDAGMALMQMLKEQGNFIRPLEAVRRLKDEHEIRIGSGKPGRETSDLSAAIGHGRVPGLVVTRSQGYGLAEWNGFPPGPIKPPVASGVSMPQVSDPVSQSTGDVPDQNNMEE